MEYPQRLSRGLALVKWWLLAIPQYIIIGLFTSGVPWVGSLVGHFHSPIIRPSVVINGWGLYNSLAIWPSGMFTSLGWGGLGLIGIVALIAAVVLLVTGRYPERIFDFVLGMNRWVLRVAGYAGLMTDKYPPFRLDMGGPDPGTLTLPPTAGPGPG